MSLPKPYYDEDGITIYHGDCRDHLPPPGRYSSVFVLTDPPYGIGYSLAPQIVGQGNRRVLMGGKPPIYGDAEPFDPSHLFRFDRLVLWGANHYAPRLPDHGTGRMRSTRSGR